MKFIKGRWYKSSAWSSRRDFIKYKSHGRHSIHGSVYIIRSEFENTATEWSLDAGCVSEASYEEYSKFLPKGHPDLIPQSITQIKII